ncbi:MAG TPA: hypothetical protein EYP65_00160, partial [Armatimonadetes bacterium]|nr:hypothetical protein [Armatimonadota bacterium]
MIGREARGLDVEEEGLVFKSREEAPVLPLREVAEEETGVPLPKGLEPSLKFGVKKGLLEGRDARDARLGEEVLPSEDSLLPEPPFGFWTYARQDGEGSFDHPFFSARQRALPSAGKFFAMEVGNIIQSAPHGRGRRMGLRGLLSLRAIALVMLLAFTAYGVGAWERRSISLDGTWEFKPLLVSRERVGGQWREAKELGWTEIRVPSMWREGLGEPVVGLPEEWVHCHKALYRRTFEVPADWRGKRVFIRFEGVASLAKIKVNGQPVGVHLGGWVPFEVDVTPFLRFGGRNEVEVEVTDFTCVLEGDFKSGEALPEGVLLSPEPLFAGIWGSVSLEARPQVYIEEAHILPYRGKVEVRLRVRNSLEGPASVRVSCRALDGGWEVGRFEARIVTVGAGEGVTLLLRGRVDPARRWSMSRPKVLSLEAVLSDPETGEVVDRVVVPFGYRAVEVDGSVFSLNGRPLFLKGAEVDLFDLPFGSDVELRKALRALKAGLKLNAILAGGGVHPERVLRVADKAGMLVLYCSMLSGGHLAWSREE